MAASEHSEPLPRPVPGTLFRWVKVASWFELCLFGALLFFWIAPGYDGETALFGLLHGLGYLGLCALILVTIVRRQAPWPLLAATLTPLGAIASEIPPWLPTRRRGAGRVDPLPPAAPPRRFFTARPPRGHQRPPGPRP